MLPRRTAAAALLCAASAALALRAHAAAVNRTDTHLRRAGVAYVRPEPAPAGRVKRGSRLRDAPGQDREPFGVHIYNSVNDLPPYAVTTGDAQHEKCYKRDVLRLNRVCVKGSFCGYVCEQILLAVQSFCAEKVELSHESLPGTTVQTTKWRTCEKARKFNKCFPRVCYRRVVVEESRPEIPHGVVPEPHPVKSTFAIVRYKYEPRYETEARRNRQTATQSAIFR